MAFVWLQRQDDTSILPIQMLLADLGGFVCCLVSVVTVVQPHNADHKPGSYVTEDPTSAWFV